VRVDFYQFATGTFSLVSKQLEELAQCCIVSRKGQVSIAQHERKVELFDCDYTVLISKLFGELMPKVSSSVRDMILNLRDLHCGFTSALAATFAPIDASLSNTQLPALLSEPAGVVDQFAIGQSQQAFDSNVNPDNIARVLRYCNVGQFKLKICVPLAVFTLNDNLFDLGILRNRSVQAHFDFANMLDVKPITREFASIAMTVCHRLKAVASFEPRESSNAFVKCAIRLIDTTQHLLNRRGVQHVQFIGHIVAQITKPGPLIVISDAPSASAPVPPAFIQGVVVYGLHLKQNFIEQVFLFLRRSQRVFVS
jgi:hypothetical protein